MQTTNQWPNEKMVTNKKNSMVSQITKFFWLCETPQIKIHISDNKRIKLYLFTWHNIEIYSDTSFVNCRQWWCKLYVEVNDSYFFKKNLTWGFVLFSIQFWGEWALAFRVLQKRKNYLFEWIHKILKQLKIFCNHVGYTWLLTEHRELISHMMNIIAKIY
jgi:hypothetical protein